MHHDAAGGLVARQVPELLPACGLLRHGLGVIGEARGAPVLGHGIDIAIDDAFGREALLLRGLVIIRQLCQVQRLDEVKVLVG